MVRKKGGKPKKGGDVKATIDTTAETRGLKARQVYGAAKEPKRTLLTTGNMTERKPAEDTLTKQRNMLQGIMDSTGVMLAYLDTGFNLVAVNSAYAKASGHSKEELIGKNYFALFPSQENYAIFERVKASGEPAVYYDKPYEFADQPERGVTYWDWTLTPLKDETGRAQGLILSLFETTQKKRAEEEIKGLSRFPAENPNPVMRISKEGTVLYCNDAALPVLNEWKCQIGQLAPSNWHKLVEGVFRSGTVKEFEEAYGTQTYSFVLAPIAEAGYVNVYGRDITRRKRAENEILLTKKEWERTFDSMPDLIAILDAEHRIVRANKSMAQRLGMNTEQCEGLNCFKYVHKLAEPPSYCPHALTMADGKEHVAEIHDPNLGGDFLVSTTPLFSQEGKIIGSVHVARDITERKKAEQALRESQIDLNRAQAVAKTGSWRLDLLHNELLWSDETYRLFEIPKGTPMTYEAFLNAIHPDDREYVDQKWKAALRGEPYDIEHRIIVDGKVKWVRERAELELGKDGVLTSGFGTVEDITERRRMEQELRESLEGARRRESEISALLRASRSILENQQFQQAAQSIFDCCKELVGATAGYVALMSKDGKENEVLFLDAGGQACSVDPSLPMPIRGLRAEAYRTNKVVYNNDFLQSEWIKLIPGGHVALQNVLFAPLVIDARTVGIMGLANKPGGFTDHDDEMALAFGELASIALINSRNLESLEDNQKRLMEYSQNLEEMVQERTMKLQEAQRLATIGETAGMVGHDIRNPLQSIEGAVYLAKEELKSLSDSEEKKELSEILGIVENQTSYIDHIVAELQDFARTPILQTKETNIQELITDALSMIEIPENIEIQTLFQEDKNVIIVDPTCIKRVLINLIENAVQAMPNGGKLTIRTHGEPENVNVDVEDTGSGISEAHKEKIFTPLFTTKAKGQGFGLSVCKKLVEAHHGQIKFESEIRKGTTFKIKLPRTTKVN